MNSLRENEVKRYEEDKNNTMMEIMNGKNRITKINVK